MVHQIILTLVFALCSGVLGRMGGAGKSGQWYDFLLDTKWRDFGCPTMLVLTLNLWLGWHPMVYTAVWLLSLGACVTYWKKLFGEITMWFSGLMMGAAMYPIVFIDQNLYVIVVARALVLMIVWECLTRYLPAKVLVWRRDVVDEFCRYFVSL